MKNNLFSNDEHSIEEGLINLTPLIDVVFVVLISFIIIAPMVRSERVNLVKAKDQSSSMLSSQKQFISIQVTENNTIYLNEKVISINHLKHRLSSLKQQYPHEIPIIYHDRSASFGTYQALKNSLESCGFDEMHIMLAPN